jgi:hypothetical protein
MQSNAAFADDRRIEPRWPAERARFALWSPLLHLQPELVDYNSHGLAFRVPASAPLAVGTNVSLVLQTGRAVPLVQLIARVGSLTRQAGTLRVGGSIEDAKPVSRQGLWLPSTGDVVRVAATEQYRHVLSWVRRHGAPAMFLCRSTQVAANLHPVPREVNVGSVHVELPVGTDLTGAEWASVAFSIHGARFALDGALRCDEAGRIFLGPPLELRSLSRRRCDRVLVEAEEAVVRWRHPLDPTQEVSAPAHDLSPHGVGILSPAVTALLPPAGRSPLTLAVRGELLQLDGELAHVSQEGPLVRFGFHTTARGAGAAIRIAHLCRSVRFPKLSARASAPRDAVDGLLRESGYMGLCKQARPPAEWHQPITDESISLDTIQREPDGSLIGHLSCLRVYGSTWMYHQLATVGQSQISRACRRALYLDTANFVALLGGDTWYSLAYFDRSKPWHRLLFGEFIEWVGSESLAVIAPLDRFEGDHNLRDTAEPPAGLSMGKLTTAEAANATALIAKSLPLLALEALDLSEPLVAQSLRCARRYALAGRERDRYPLALRDGGRLVGLAMCETGSAGLSLFNLLNMAQVFIEPNVCGEAQVSFLRYVRLFYELRGIADPVVVAPPGVLTHAKAAGLTLAETMGAIVISAEGFKQYRNFLSFHLGRHARLRSPPRGSEPVAQPLSRDLMHAAQRGILSECS